MLKFEWEEDKAQRNALKHGVPFEQAIDVFNDNRRLELIDDRYDYGEERIIALEQAKEKLIAVVFVLRGNSIRIISARNASKEEANEYFTS